VEGQAAKRNKERELRVRRHLERQAGGRNEASVSRDDGPDRLATADREEEDGEHRQRQQHGGSVSLVSSMTLLST